MTYVLYINVYFCMLKLAVFFLIKRKDQLSFIY